MLLNKSIYLSLYGNFAIQTLNVNNRILVKLGRISVNIYIYIIVIF